MEATLAQERISLKSLVFPTDFSESSEAALPFALAFARHYGSMVYLAYIHEPQTYPLSPQEAVFVPFEDIRQFAEAQMNHLSGRLKEIPHRTVTGKGEIKAVLPEIIRKNEIDWIVMGTHGRTGLGKLLLGSTAEKFLRLAPVPVLTVGPKVARRPAEGLELRHILCDVAWSPGTEQVVGYSFSLAQEHQSRLTLLHVVNAVPIAAGGNWDSRRTFKLLRKIVPPDAELWCEPEFAVEFGNPAEKILSTAKSRDADLIVQGRGSAAYKVACQARCPVLTVPG